MSTHTIGRSERGVTTVPKYKRRPPRPSLSEFQGTEDGPLSEFIAGRLRGRYGFVTQRKEWFENTGAVWRPLADEVLRDLVRLELKALFDVLYDENPKRAPYAILNRGKVECFLRYHPTTSQGQMKINEDLVHELNAAADAVHAIIGPGNTMNVLEVLKWPGVISAEETDSKVISQQAVSAFADCVSSLKDIRQREGEELGKLISQRIERIAEIVSDVQQQLPAALEAQRQQLLERFKELAVSVDEDRLETEMVMLAQKADVAEELDRLNTHVNEVKRILTMDEPIGRRLDFMMQELNREANTLSSKSLTTGITQAAVDLKVLIEQMREQVQNIE